MSLPSPLFFKSDWLPTSPPSHVPPAELFVRNVSAARVASMQRYIEREVRPAVLFDYRGRAPDAFSAFLTELLHLSRTKLNKLDQAPARG